MFRHSCAPSKGVVSNTPLEDGTGVLKQVGVAILQLYFTQIVHSVDK